MISQVTDPREVFLHNSAALELALGPVNLNKPANCREAAFTDKTGGCNSEASVVERMSVYVPERVRQADREVTGGADSHYYTNQSTGIRKGSVIVRGVAAKGFSAV